MSVLSDEPVDHERVIAFLAKKATLPLDEVRRLYEHEWAALDSAARIKGFVPILTVRHVRELLRKSRGNAIKRPPTVEISVPG